MSLPLIDGFIFDNFTNKSNATNITTVGCSDYLLYGNKNIERFSYFNFGDCIKEGANIYVPSLMLPEKELDFLIEVVIEKRLHLMVKTAETLEEVGLFDTKFKLSPIMLLSKMGLLENSVIVGGVYLDKDDTALMVQENARLVITPTMSAGYGYGLAPIISYINSGIKINLGAGDCKFNANADILQEAKFLKLATSAVMNKQNALSLQSLSQILCGTKNYAQELEVLLK